MENAEKPKEDESLEIRVIRRGNTVQAGGGRSYGFIILALIAVGLFVYMKWFHKPQDAKSDVGEIPAPQSSPSGGASPSGGGLPSGPQFDIPIPSENGRP